ncbi:hypothetical protein JOM56_010438 [Amanita muscaria]
MLDALLLDDPFARREPPPAYSFEPCSGEQRLEITPRHGRGHTPLGSIIKKFGKITLVIPDQEDGAQIPTYGRNDVISGVFCFDDPSRITKVTIKVRGEVETTATESGAKTTRLLDDPYTLWQKDANADESSCPHQLDFACALPSNITREAIPLPPSFHFFDPGFYVKTFYRIFVEITRKRRSKFDFSPSVKRYSVPFKYCPRSRPNRPFEPIPYFLSSVKTSPEEWHQTTSTLKTYSNQLTHDTLHCHLFVPSVRIFGLSDNIPFHIQLNGPISSLHGFFPPDALQRVASSDTSLSVPSIRPKSAKKRFEVQQHSVRVQILRQVVVMDDGRKVWRNSNIGEGVVHPLPPPLYRDRCLGTREESLDWEGFVKCNDDVKVGSLSTGLFHVHVRVSSLVWTRKRLRLSILQHFLSLTLTPPDVRRSPFQVLNIHVPVRLVTDSYQEFG